MLTEGHIRRRATAEAKRKTRYDIDKAYRTKIKAAALAWYYRNRERVLERMKAKRTREGV